MKESNGFKVGMIKGEFARVGQDLTSNTSTNPHSQYQVPRHNHGQNSNFFVNSQTIHQGENPFNKPESAPNQFTNFENNMRHME